MIEKLFLSMFLTLKDEYIDKKIKVRKQNETCILYSVDALKSTQNSEKYFAKLLRQIQFEYPNRKVKSK
jgi:hypothetical protein